MVELKHVSFRYGSEESEGELASSLSDVSLTVRDGEFVLLTGPSGCGKTTILRLINGLIPHFYPGMLTGSVTIDGQRVQERELYETAVQVGTVFQNPRSQFYNVDTTGELAFGCENRGLPEREIYERIDNTVSRFHLEKLTKHLSSFRRGKAEDRLRLGGCRWTRDHPPGRAFGQSG